MRKTAERVRRAGRYGDTELVHLNRQELARLEEMWGKPTRNPKTGLPEFFLGGLLGSILPIIVPAATEAIGGAGTLGSLASSIFDVSPQWADTLGAAGLGGLTGLGTSLIQGRDPLAGGLAGAALGAAVPSAGQALGFQGFTTPFNIPTLFDVGGLFDAAKPAASAVGDLVAGTSPDANLGGAGFAPSGDASAAGGGKGALSWLKSNPWALPVALAGLTGLAGQGSAQQPQQTQGVTPGRPSSWANYQFPTGRLARRRLTPEEQNRNPGVYYADNQLPDVPIAYAHGGEVAGALSAPSLAAGRQRGPGDGRDDLIPAALSNGEYVMDAETMALLGNGDPDAGADKLDQMRINLRKHKGRALAKGKFSPDAKPAEGYLS